MVAKGEEVANLEVLLLDMNRPTPLFSPTSSVGLHHNFEMTSSPTYI